MWFSFQFSWAIWAPLTHIGALQSQGQFLQVNAAKERSEKAREELKYWEQVTNVSEDERAYFEPAGPENDAWWEHGCDLERKSDPSSQAASLEPDQITIN